MLFTKLYYATAKMKIVFISDTHNRHIKLYGEPNTPGEFELPDGDTIVHCGDLTGRGGLSEIRAFLKWFSSLDKYKNKIFIAGNHDFAFETISEICEAILTEYPNITYLNNSGITIDGINFWGSPATPYFFDWAFNYQRGEDIAKIWSLIPKNTDVLITHGPPYKILDQVPDTKFNPEVNVGCKDLLNVINEINPKIHAFGHIHCDNGIQVIAGTTFINASALNDKYEPENPPTVIEL